MFFLLMLLFCAVPPTLLTLLAVWRKALTPFGYVTAWVLGYIIMLEGWGWGFAILTAVFLFTLLAGKLGGARGKEIGRTIHAKHGPRDAVQVLCNVGVGAACLLLFGANDDASVFRWAYCGAMAASLADSMASELGVLSKKPPVDILRCKPVTPGLSGGVTLLGCLASLLGALLIAAISYFWEKEWLLLPVVTGCGFVAALCDSLLGSLCQKKYRCPVCGALTEKKLHCNTPGHRETGFLNNDSVNFINNLIGAGCAAGLYLLLH